MRFTPKARSSILPLLCLGVLAAVPMLSGTALAQDEDVVPVGEREFRFDFGVFGGAHFFDDEHGLGRNEDDPAHLSPAHAGVFGGRLGLNFNRWVTLELEASATATKTESGFSDVFIFGYRGSLLLHLTDRYAFRPFIALGYGGLTSIVNEDQVPGVIPASDTDGFFHAGLGFKIGFGDRSGLRIDGRIMAPGAVLGEVLAIGDETGFEGPDFQILAGLFINFGEVPPRSTIVKQQVTVFQPTSKDPDGDGIIGAADKCPEQPEDRDGFEDEDGCAEGDNDKDGIPDTRDRCPSDAEDKDAFQDEDGCPEPDNDVDGIADAQDKCPNEAEDKDGFQDEDGCPEPDNDLDGMLDSRDRCPNEPETRNQFQDDDGCPDEIPVEVKRFMGVIEGINFKTNSAEILPGSYGLLDRAVTVLREYGDLRLEISGHTDSRGKPDYNRDLSQRRAESVKSYLVARGIDASRLVTIGYGLDRPVADNGTAAGRAKNRRIEFRLIDATGN